MPSRFPGDAPGAALESLVLDDTECLGDPESASSCKRFLCPLKKDSQEGCQENCVFFN